MHITIIDDEVLLSTTIEKKIVEQGYQVRKIHSLKDFSLEDILRTDLMLLDISLTDGSGFEILKSIKQHPTAKYISIIMISAHGDVETKIQGLDLGADDYLVKPFSPDELMARIRSNLRKRGTHSHEKTLSHGNIEFHLESREVSVSGLEVVLSRKEKLILEFFMRNKNQLIPKHDLASRFWKDKKLEVNDNIINVTLCNLRKKLGGFEDLETRSGQGYILKEKKDSH